MFDINNISFITSGAVSVFEEPMDEASQAIAKKITKDLMYIKFELLHANINRNKDNFQTEELMAAVDTIVDKPINWEHRPSEIIGHIYNSEYIPFKEDGADASSVDTETDKIVCEGVIYKYKLPQRAKEIQARHQKRDLFFSMETYFDKAECSVCGKKFESDRDYCSHLSNRFRSGAEGSRILRGLLFGGAGCVEHPADDAKGLVLANQKKHIISSLIDVFGSNFTEEEYLRFMREMK